MSRLKRITMCAAAVVILAWAGAALQADEPSALCCNYGVDCTVDYPMCMETTVDCDITVQGHQNYCMRPPSN